jgi:hypothetical protein
MSLASEAELAGLYNMGAQGSVHQDHTRQIRTQAMANAPTNRQCNGRRRHQWQSTTKKNQDNGHEVPLAKRLPIQPTISNLLATWKIELCKLLDKASSRITSSQHAQRIPHTIHHSRNVTNRATTIATAYNGSSPSIESH